VALKKSRPITVRDQAFRWKFKPHKDNQTRFGGSARFAHVAVQENTERPGLPMVAQIESMLEVPEDSDVQNGVLHKARFTPGDVRMLIESCLDAGWDPSAKQQFQAPAGLELTDYRTISR
jgi:hypothetical protein